MYRTSRGNKHFFTCLFGKSSCRDQHRHQKIAFLAWLGLLIRVGMGRLHLLVHGVPDQAQAGRGGWGSSRKADRISAKFVGFFQDFLGCLNRRVMSKCGVEADFSGSWPRVRDEGVVRYLLCWARFVCIHDSSVCRHQTIPQVLHRSFLVKRDGDVSETLHDELIQH